VERFQASEKMSADLHTTQVSHRIIVALIHNSSLLRLFLDYELPAKNWR